MNYFEFFGLPVAPRIDEALLKRQFYANSKAFHPDFHTLSDEATQEEVLEKSTVNNQGYKVLTDPDRRLRHLLELRGALGEEGTNKMPQSFLMEIMDLNEALMELEMDDDPATRAKVEKLIAELEAGFDAEVGDLLTSYDDTTATPADLERLKDYYLKRRYVRRIKQRGQEM